MNIYESTKCKPYVYVCTHKETKEFYIGFRYKNVGLGRPSHIDLPLYRTSSKTVKPRFNEFDWVVIAEFFNSQDAYDFEQMLINNHWGNPLLLNRTNHYGAKTRFLRESAPKWTDQSRAKLSRSVKGKPKPTRTEEHTKNLKAALKGRKPPPLSDRSIQLMREKALQRPMKVCPHCGHSSTGNTIYRWHFDNCKSV